MRIGRRDIEQGVNSGASTGSTIPVADSTGVVIRDETAVLVRQTTLPPEHRTLGSMFAWWPRTSARRRAPFHPRLHPLLAGPKSISTILPRPTRILLARRLGNSILPTRRAMPLPASKRMVRIQIAPPALSFRRRPARHTQRRKLVRRAVAGAYGRGEQAQPGAALLAVTAGGAALVASRGRGRACRAEGEGAASASLAAADGGRRC